MDIVTRRRAKAIFQEALERPPSDRAVFVATQSRGDEELSRAAWDLLASHESAGEFLGEPTFGGGQMGALGAGGASATAPFAGIDVDAEKPGAVVGRYVLQETIGSGGFGSVWRAEQTEPVRRTVALKVIKLGMDTKVVVARFEAERQALALMDHPNIAQVFDAGATATGRPYFVMELVRGVPITRFCDEHRLSTRARLELFASVCRAVQHAHQKGVIHRDIKPGNVLVALHDGEPVAKVIDFGIAKATSARLTELTLHTAFHQMMGTPEYMAPEQAEASGLDVDTRADVYSLGALLYELLTGQKPFDLTQLFGHGWDEVVRTIREVDPPRPSARVAALDPQSQSDVLAHRDESGSLVRRLRGDLDWIVMKALEKDRARRYETATALAEDVERHLADLPVIASPPSRAYQLSKLVRRHRATFVAALIVFVTLLLGIAISAYGFVEARDQRDRATDREKRANAELATRTQVAQLMADMLQGAGPEVARGRDATLLREILDQTGRRIETELVGQDEVRGALLGVMGSTYRDIGDFEQSEKLLRESAQLRRTTLGARHREVGVALLDLSLTLTDRDRLDEAESLAREGLAILREQPVPPWLALVNGCNDLGIVLRHQHATVEAGQLFHESLDIAHAHPEIPMQASTTALGELAELARWRGDMTEAETLNDQILEQEKKQFGDDHPRTIAAENNVAVVLLDTGRAEAARERLVTLLERTKRVHGEQSAPVGWTLENLARSSERLLKPKRALQEYDEAIAAYRAAYQGDHGDTVRALFRRGHLALSAGSNESAETDLRECVEMSRRLASIEQDSSEALVDLGWIEERRGNHEEALKLVREGVESSIRRSGASARATGLIHNELGGILLAQKRPAEALQPIQTALSILREAPHADPHEVATVLCNLMEAQRQSGDFVSAESAAREALDLYSARLPQETTRPEMIRFALVGLLCAQQRCEEAGALAEEVARARRAQFEDGDGRHGPMMAGYAQELFYGGCFEPAAVMAREAIAIERARAKPDADAFVMAAGTLSSILVEWPEGSRREEESLDESVALARECLERVDAAHPDAVRRSGQELLLGIMLIERGRRVHDEASLAEGEPLVRSALSTRAEKLGEDDWRTQIARATLAAAHAVPWLSPPATSEDAARVTERRAALIEARDAMLPACEALRDRTDLPEAVRRLRLPIAFTMLARTMEALADGSEVQGSDAERARAEAWRAAAITARKD